jgi:hypothetical protein
MLFGESNCIMVVMHEHYDCNVFSGIFLINRFFVVSEPKSNRTRSASDCRVASVASGSMRSAEPKARESDFAGASEQLTLTVCLSRTVFAGAR